MIRAAREQAVFVSRHFGVFPAERGRVVRAHVVAGRAPRASIGVGAAPNDAIDAIVTQSVHPSGHQRVNQGHFERMQ